MAEHTPGPLRLPRKGDDFEGACVLRDDGHIVADCNVFFGENPITNAECLANAQLFIAAPDLLAACEFFSKFAALRADRGDLLPTQLVESVSAAIRKAGGKVTDKK
jgi:hypothetical protein